MAFCMKMPAMSPRITPNVSPTDAADNENSRRDGSTDSDRREKP